MFWCDGSGHISVSLANLMFDGDVASTLKHEQHNGQAMIEYEFVATVTPTSSGAGDGGVIEEQGKGHGEGKRPENNVDPFEVGLQVLHLHNSGPHEYCNEQNPEDRGEAREVHQT